MAAEKPVSAVPADWRGVIAGACLFAAALLFCLNFYACRFVIQGDVFLNLYIHGYPALFKTGWDPYAWGYLGWYPISGGLFPLNAVMHLFTGGAAPLVTLRALEVNAFLSLFLLSLFCYLFLRRLGRSRFGAACGSLLVMAAGFHVHTGIRQFDLFYLHSFMFVPLALLFLAKAGEEEPLKNSLLAGFCVGLSLLGGGNAPMFLFLPFLFAAPLIGGGLAGRRGASGAAAHAAAYSAVALAAGFAVGAAMLLPSLKYMPFSNRAAYMGWTPQDAKSVFYTFKTMLYRNWFPGADVNFHEYDAYIGLPALLFILAGAVYSLRARLKASVFMLALAVFALVCMHLPLTPDWAQPALKKIFAAFSFRYPYRFFMVFLLAAAYFAACGADWLKSVAAKKEIRAFALAAALAFAAYLRFGAAVFSVTPAPEQLPAVLRVFLSSALVAAVPLLYLLRAGPAFSAARDFTLAAALFMPLYLGFSAWPNKGLPDDRDFNRFAPFYPLAEGDALLRVVDAPAARIKKITAGFKEPYRVFMYPRLGRMHIWAPKEKTELAFEPMGDPSSPLLLERYLRAVPGLDSPMVDLYNVAVINTPYRFRKFAPSGVPGLYTNPRAFSRFFVVHGTRCFSSEPALFAALGKAGAEELKSSVFLESGGEFCRQPAVLGAQDRVEILERAEDKIVLRVDAGAPGWLAASDIWFPAWTAEVNGAPAAIFKAYGAFRAVRIAQGKSVVVFSFRDNWARAGRVITLVCALGILGGCLLLRRKKA